jgi:hypothetical protein
MYYEWDAAKARRMYLIKFAAVWLAAIVIVAIPVFIAFKVGALAGSHTQVMASIMPQQ